MPVKVARLRSGEYQVKTPNAVHAKETTKVKALKQRNLLNAIEHNPEFKKMIVGKKRK